MGRKAIGTILISILLTIFLFSGCSASGEADKGKSPEHPAAAIVDTYLTAAQKLDSATMAEAVSPTSTTGTMGSTTHVYLMGKVLADYLRSTAAEMTYKITGAEADENKAEVTAEIRYVDVAPLMKEVFSELESISKELESSGKASEFNYETVLTDVMNKKTVTAKKSIKESTLKINCIKVEDKWYISEVGDDLANAVMSNFVTFVNEMQGTSEP